MADRDDAPETRPVPPPTIGSYRLVEPLGSGGMSSVFRALHKETGHEVAVKVLPRYLAKNPTLLQRFLREAKSAESLEDPNIVAIYDRGSESGRHYLVLEYVPGGDLHDRVREDGPLPIDEAIKAVRQVALGLRHAAGRGLIHRDIKPANILRRPDGVVKVTDLGLALQAEDDEKVTRDGTTVGTVDYMAPEQARDSRATSLKSDIYSLGCTFYYLLTGTPPFAGGDVAEKLRAHATEAPPDVRAIRPAVPAALAKLIQKMMAKRPEKRFADYDALIAALDVVSGRAEPAKVPLYALIDDDDEEEAPGGELPLQALIDEDDLPDPDGAGPLYALVDDSQDDDAFNLGPGPARASGGSTASTPTLGSLGGSEGVNLSALEGMEEESEPLPGARKPPPGAPGGNRPGSRALAAVPGPPPEDVFDLAPVPSPLPHLYEVAPRPREGFDWAGWITRLTLLAVAALVIAFGWTRLSPYLFEEEPRPLDVPGLEDTNKARPGGVGPQAQRPGEPWAEPEDVNVAPPKEPPVPAEALARLDLADAAREALSRDEAPRVEVRRVDPIRDREHLADLPRAFENIGGTVTVADDGPFFEEPWRMVGESRVLLRAAPGYRPVIVLGRPETDSARKRPAALVLEGQSLVVQGIDFVIDGSGLSPVQQSMFLLRNASLTLRDCTVSVVGKVGHDYAVVQVGDRGSAEKLAPSTVRFERAMIRGAASAVRLAGSARVTFARSLVACETGSALEFAGEPRADRSIATFRSAIASPGPLISLIGAAGASNATPPTVRAMESTFARVGAESRPGTPFVGLVETPPGPPRSPVDLIDWRGESDSFAGWEAWSSGSPPGVLAGLRGGKPDAERSSREERDAWPAAVADPWNPAPLSDPGVKALVIPPPRVATPTKSLKERTLQTFGGLVIHPSGPEGRELALRFDADDESYSGDLGKFLAEKVSGATRAIHVSVTGSGRHAMTTVNLPDGVSLSVSVAPVRPGRPPVIWTTPDDATGEALISVKNARLDLEGVRLTATPKTHLPTLLSVNHGQLDMARCILIGPAGDESAGGRLIEFRTDGTRPFPDADGASRGTAASCHLRDCVLMTGGDAITAEIGRGALILENCAVASASTALVLRPEKVRRDRFEADLFLSRCTVAAMENVVRLRAWPGLGPGPDRPWVLRSKDCVFSDGFERTQNVVRGVLLRTEVEGLSHGVLAWQSTHDVYDLTGFTVGGQINPTAVARADIRRGWADLWGGRHVESPSGYTASGGVPAARFLVKKLKALDFEPADLALDPSYPPGRRGLDVGADLSWLGIAPPAGKPKPPGR